MYILDVKADGLKPGWRSPGVADRLLKSVSGWRNSGNGNEISGLDFQPAGCRLANGDGFIGAGSQTFF
jgi:hypothetical protein